MKRYHTIISLFLFVLVLSACSDRELAGKLREFRNVEIITAVEVERVSSRKISSCIPEPVKARLVVYYDSLECSSCGIHHLYDRQELYMMTDSLDSFDVLTVFSPRGEEYDQVMKELMLFGFPYPVYVDSYGDFRRANSAIPSDKRFHTFLLDRSGHPVFVGNPVASSGLRELFDKVLDNILENDGYYVESNR